MWNVIVKSCKLMAGLAVPLILSHVYPLQPLPSNLKVQGFSVEHVLRNLRPTSIETLATTAGIAVDYASLETSSERRFVGIKGSESVYVIQEDDLEKGIVLDRYGNLYSGILSSAEKDWQFEAYTGPGRPLGFHVLHDTGKTRGRVIICNALMGLLSLDLNTKHLSVLSNTYDVGDTVMSISYANDLDVDISRSVIYFTDSASIPPALNRDLFYDTMKSYVLSALSGRGTGKLLQYDIIHGRTTLLMDNLYFANGVAVSDSGDYILVAETSAMRITKYYVANKTSKVLIDGLPGYPDGLCRSKDGTFWVAIIAPCKKHSLVFEIFRSPKPVRWAISWILEFLNRFVNIPKLPKLGMILKIDGETGNIIRVLIDRGKRVSGVSGVHEQNGTLYLGHLQHEYITMIHL